MLIPKILIVEDELLIAKDISLILEQEGYHTHMGITTVGDAIVALSMSEYAIVLIDINLKNGSDGVELGNYLLQLDTIPYIYITSHADNVTLDRLKDSRPYGIIIKPFKPLDIKTTVSVVLNNYKYKKIDVLRDDEMSNDDVPFILKEVVKYIDNNIFNRIDINQLSQLTRWSSQHFIRVFTQFMGDTPYQYILKKKIEKSKVLIIETDIAMKDIAFELGFLSYGNFCKLFKRETGKKPDEYRKFKSISRHINKNKDL
jgi:AraC-like DNA-binding protein/CheY-like chemotaxis protein